MKLGIVKVFQCRLHDGQIRERYGQSQVGSIRGEPLPQPLVSQHLRILKAAGVVAGERTGREVHYRLVDDHLAEIVLAAVAHAGEYTEGETR